MVFGSHYKDSLLLFLDISKKNIIFATVKNSEHDKKNNHLLLAMLHECSNNTGTRTDRQRWNKGR